MKTILLFIAAFAAAMSAHANFYLPNAKLAGETVHVGLTQELGIVSAVFEFEEWQTREPKLVYFPMFANDDDDPLNVLARSRFELEICGKQKGIATPCVAPKSIKLPQNSPRVFWFVVNIDDLVDYADFDPNGHLVIKVNYNQPLIRGRLFYLPVIAGWTGRDRNERTGEYQLHAQAGARMPRVMSGDSDCEQLRDGVVVYLRDAEVVVLQ
jgi:hypothetical protein